MAVEPSENEEEYFKKLNAEKQQKIREEKRENAMHSEVKNKIKENFNTTQDVADELFELGFSDDSVRLLPLVPLVELAWADGIVQREEREHILDEARSHGFDANSDAIAYLEELLEDQPSEGYFTRVRNVMDAIIDDHDAIERGDVLALADDLAGRSSQWFGLFSGIDDNEKEMLDILHDELS